MKSDNEIKNKAIKNEVQKMYDNGSSEYESCDSHQLSFAEKIQWQEKIFDNHCDKKFNHLLEIGCGTGLLTQYLYESKLANNITGIDLSENMLQNAKDKNLKSVNYKILDTHQSSNFIDNSFDCIVSRQVICHFHDPLQAFENWHKWLSKDGLVILLEGFWERDGWENDKLVDALPLSCLQTRGTISYLLKKSGFEIVNSHFLNIQNKYFIVAQKI